MAVPSKTLGPFLALLCAAGASRAAKAGGFRAARAPRAGPRPTPPPAPSPAGAPDFTGVYIGDDGSAGVGLGSAFAWVREGAAPARAGALELSLGAAAPGAECAAGAGGAADYNVTYTRLGLRADGGVPAAEPPAELAPDGASGCDVGTVSAAEWAYTLDGPCVAGAPRREAARFDLGAASPFAFDAAAGCGALSGVSPPTPEAFAASYAPVSPAALAALPQLPNAGAPPFLRGIFVRKDADPSSVVALIFNANGTAFARVNAAEGPGSLGFGTKSFLAYECLAPCERARARRARRGGRLTPARPPPAPPRRQVPRDDGDTELVHERCVARRAAPPRPARRAAPPRPPPRPPSRRPALLSRRCAPPAGTSRADLRCEVGEYDAAARRLRYSFAPATACPTTTDQYTADLALELVATDGARAPCAVGAPEAAEVGAPAAAPVQSAAAPARAAQAAAAAAALAALLA
jgi:hypothetical protein